MNAIKTVLAIGLLGYTFWVAPLWVVTGFGAAMVLSSMERIK